MKKLKIDYLLVAALMLGGGMAVATQSPKQPGNALITQWQRVAQDAQDEGQWQPLTSAECEASDKLCKASFADGYDPREHTEAENESAAIPASVETGFVPQ
jgi:predicted DNA-binding WGR domain protein